MCDQCACDTLARCRRTAKARDKLGSPYPTILASPSRCAATWRCVSPVLYRLLRLVPLFLHSLVCSPHPAGQIQYKRHAVYRTTITFRSLITSMPITPAAHTVDRRSNKYDRIIMVSLGVSREEAGLPAWSIDHANARGRSVAKQTRDALDSATEVSHHSSSGSLGQCRCHRSPCTPNPLTAEQR